MATYNVRHGLGRDGILDIERCARVVREVEPDVVALQELDRGMERSGRLDQPSIFERVTGMKVAFFPTLTRDGGEYGIGVAARAELDAEFAFLPRVSEEEPRGLITGRTGGVTILATHLSRSKPARRLQIAEIAVRGRGSARVVVLGDFNAPPRELAPLRDAGLHVPSGPATLGRRRIDYIAAAPDIAVERVWTAPAPASDHDLLAASLRL